MPGCRRVASSLFALLVLIAAVPAGAGQDAEGLVGLIVRAVRFDVEGRLDTSPQLAALVDIEVGEPLTRAEWRSSLGRLASVGRFEDASVFAEATGDGGVIVTFRLVPRHPVNRLEISGETGISTGDLRRRVLQRYGGVPTDVRPANVESAARQLLADEGFLDAVVTSEVVPTHNPDAATLVLQVEAGPRIRIVRTLVNSRLLPADEVIRRTGTRPGQPFRQRELAAALVGIEDDLRERGYYETQASFDPLRTQDGIELVLSIDEGPRVELRIEPAGALPGDIDELIPIAPLASADQDLLEDSRARIETALRRQGYWRATAPFTREVGGDGSLLVITFKIDRGPLFRIDRIEIPAGLSLGVETIRGLLEVSAGEVFDQARFEAGLARVIDAYRQRGYYRAEATPAYEPVEGRGGVNEAWVALHPNIDEGVQGRIASIEFLFASPPPQVPEPTLRASMRSTPGAPYVEFDAAVDENTLRTLYLDRGYRHASVEVEPVVSEDGRDVVLQVAVSEGRQVVVGEVTVAGNERVSEQAIREEMGLRPGQPLGESAFDEARRRLTAMGVFRRVAVTIEEPLGGDDAARIVVSVVEAPATTIGFGGGLEAGRQARSAVGGGIEDRLEVAPRGFFEIGRRHLGGRNRAVNLFSRISLRPRDAPGDPEKDGQGFGFSEYRVTLTYRERHAFRSETDLLIGLTSEQAQRTSFNFARQAANAEVLHRLDPRISISGRYALDFTRLFDERYSPDEGPLIDRLFPQVRLSILSTGISWDRRDNPLAPTRGTLATADAELAARQLGSQVGYIKGFFQVSLFRALDRGARTILGTRAQVGVARGFREAVPQLDPDGQPVLGPGGEPLLEPDLPISQRFFAGGGTTVRGFQLDRLGVPQILNADGLSLGGNAVIVLNAEVRRVVASLLNRNFAVVGFIDAGNVFARASDLDFDRLRRSAGFGVRYDSPLGPLRMDFGFKAAPITTGARRERRWEYHLSIGEAF